MLDAVELKNSSPKSEKFVYAPEENGVLSPSARTAYSLPLHSASLPNQRSWRSQSYTGYTQVPGHESVVEIIKCDGYNEIPHEGLLSRKGTATNVSRFLGDISSHLFTTEEGKIHERPHHEVFPTILF